MFMSKGSARHVELYKALRTLIVQNKSPFSPHKLWEGLSDMVRIVTCHPLAFMSVVIVVAVAVVVFVVVSHMHRSSSAPRTAYRGI